MSGKHLILAKSGQTVMSKCDWKGCSGSPHPNKVRYENRNKGMVDRGKYVGNWPKPFHIFTPSYENFGIKEGEFRRLSSGKYHHNKNYNSYRGWYKTEYHHVIPVDSIKGKSSLKNNLKLIGWNINDGISNGIRLPYFKEDQIWHFLQPHRGVHPKTYIDAVDEMLSSLDSVCEQYCVSSEDKCSKNDQKLLLGQALEMAEDIRNDILRWKVMIHVDTTLQNWVNTIISKRTGTTIGYFKKRGDRTIKSSKPPYPKQVCDGRTYLQ
jgi:A nuclease family of the HNH/ENDO VII superfamily with conserved AHH